MGYCHHSAYGGVLWSQTRAGFLHMGLVSGTAQQGISFSLIKILNHFETGRPYFHSALNLKTMKPVTSGRGGGGGSQDTGCSVLKLGWCQEIGAISHANCIKEHLVALLTTPCSL